MSGTDLSAIREWIRGIYSNRQERIKIRIRHIERDRIWRGIDEDDMRKALSSGDVSTIRSSDQTIFWRGRDGEGRELELQCSMVTEDGKDTLVVQDAFLLRVGTAYEPEKQDDQVKKEWLAEHPEYEELPDGRVQKKIKVTRV